MRSIHTPTTPVKCPAVVFDNLDDRREIYYLMTQLNPLKRLAFVKWFCAQAKLGPWAMVPKIKRETEQLAERAMTDSGADDRLTQDLFFDLWSVAANYHLSLDVAFRQLEKVVSRAR